MRFEHNGMEFEIPDEWWNESGMPDFRPRSSSYRPDSSTFRKLPVEMIPLAEVRPLLEREGRVFMDSVDKATGGLRVEGTARERVGRILQWFIAETGIEPVVVEQFDDGDYRYRLREGSHRFHCSVAAGFTHIPAIIVAPFA